MLNPESPSDKFVHHEDSGQHQLPETAYDSVRIKGKREIHGSPLVAHVIQQSREELWSPRPTHQRQDISFHEGRRQPNGPVVGYRVLRRCCSSPEVKQNAPFMKQPEPEREDYELGGVIVGFSKEFLHPVLMQIEEGELEDIEESEHSLISTVFRTYPHGMRCGIDIIWHENIAVPENFKYVKDGLRNQLEGEEQAQFNRKLQYEHEHRQSRLLSISSTIAHVFPNSKNKETKPRMRNLFGDIPYQDIHFELKWPRLTLFKFPKAMITAMEGFLSQLKNDVISLNLALAATVIFFDLQKQDNS